MIQLRRSKERGHADHGWLKSYHTFSFANYYDPDFMGFRDLRVINEDWIDGGTGFPTHPHKDMEIVTYIIEGALGHKDSMGNSTTIHPGEIQRMSAGTGVQHSEYNHASTRTHLLQIWLQTEKRGIAPSYGQKSFAKELAEGDLTLVISRDARQGSVGIHQDADIYAAKWAASKTVDFALKRERYAWLQVVSGPVKLNGETLETGDAAAVGDETNLKISSTGPAEFLLFDLA